MNINSTYLTNYEYVNISYSRWDITTEAHELVYKFQRLAI